MNQFDREFFGVSPEDEQYIDPQDRVLLECVYEAIVDAGMF